MKKMPPYKTLQKAPFCFSIKNIHISEMNQKR